MRHARRHGALRGALAALLLAAALPTAALADDEIRITELLNVYYSAVAEGDHDRGRNALHAILDLDPDHPVAWRGLGYDYQRRGMRVEAAKAFLRLSDDDSYMAMAAGYEFDAAGRRRDAHHAFRKAAESRNPDIYPSACRAAAATTWFRRQPLPAPYYIDVYSASTWIERFSNTFFETTVRAGRTLPSLDSVSAYLMLEHNDDLRSTTAGDVPQIFSDTFIGFGAGVDWRPGFAPGTRFFVETALNRDLLDRNRDRTRVDTSVGGAYYGAWGEITRCAMDAEMPMTHFGDLYVSAIYRSRLSNTLGQATLRQGLNLFNYRYTLVGAYARVNLLADSDGEFFNNLVEIGPGISWRPHTGYPLELRGEYLRGYYTRGTGTGDGNYGTFRIQAIIGFRL